MHGVRQAVQAKGSRAAPLCRAAHGERESDRISVQQMQKDVQAEVPGGKPSEDLLRRRRQGHQVLQVRPDILHEGYMATAHETRS